MIHIRFSKWSGLALILGSLLFILNKADQISRVILHRRLPDLITGDDALLVLIGQILLAVGWLGCFKRYASSTGTIGRLALRLLLGGGIALSIGHITFVLPATPISRQLAIALDGPLFLLVVFGTLGVVVGLTIFGLDALRTRTLAQWSFLPLACGVAGFAFISLNAETPTIESLLSRIVFGLGLVALGTIMWMDVQPRVQPTDTLLPTATELP